MREPALDWHGIVAEVRRRGFSMSELARVHGYHPSLFNHVKTKCHYQAQTIIAACIDKEVWELWPERYLTYKPQDISNRYRELLESKKIKVDADMGSAA